jgi:DNA-binding SARP family transcriptional activator
MRRIAGTATTLAGVAVLLLLIAGIPLMLVLLVGWPLPHTLPSWSQITLAFQTQGIDDGVLLHILACALWVLWAYLMLGMAVELVATLRGVQGRRRPWVAPGQRLAALLVSVVMFGIALMSRPAAPARPASLAAALAPVQHSAVLAAPHDALTDLIDHRSLQPGSPAPVATPAGVVRSLTGEAAPEQEVTVVPGDTLWAIAGEEYQNPTEWPRIWEANEGQTEDDGRVFTDPHWIYPGWELEVPGVGGAVDVPAPSTPMPAPTPPAPAPSMSAAPAASAAIPTAPASPTPTPAPTPTTAAPGAVPGEGATTPPHDGSPSAPQEGGWGVVLAEGGVMAGATAAAVVGLLLAAQRHERWRRRPGTSGGSRVALLARRPNLRRIRAALASATAREGMDAQPDQPQAAAFEATLERLQRVPGRILIGHRGGSGAEVVVDIDQLHRLALTGPGAEGAARAMLVSFLAHHAWWDAAAIVADAAAPPASPTAVLIPTPADTPGLTHLSIDSFLAHLEATIRRHRGVLEGEQQRDWHERVDGPDPLETLLAVVRTEDLSPEQLQLLGALADQAVGCAVALVLVGGLVDAPWSRPLPVATDGGVGEGATALVGGASVLYRLSEAEAADLVNVVAAGRGPDIVPDLTAEEEAALAIVDDSDERSRPEPGSPVSSASAAAPVLTFPPALERRRVEVRLYGRVRILLDDRELVKGLPDAGRQVLALLAVRGELTEEEGVSLLGAGSPDQVWRGRWVWGTRGTRAALRKLLGDDSIDPLPPARGVVRLNPDIVSSDYGRLTAGRAAARQATAPEHRLALLARAADGIRGEPFAGAPYNWLVEEQENVRSAAIDTLQELAHLHADRGDLDAAVLTIDQALSIDPDPIEDLFRQQIIWQHRLGRGDAARDLYRRLTRELSERCDTQPSEETLSLMESLAAPPHLVAGG